MAIQVLVILVPVVFGLMGFAVDLGRLYSARGELKTAANAIALAAAQRLIGTETALQNATDSGLLAVSVSSGFGNRYDFGGLVVGTGDGFYNSETPQLTFYAAAVDASGEGENGLGAEADGATARHARVTVRGEAPLIFWGLLSLGQERKLNLMSVAVAGVSAPLCTACNIEPIAVAALSQDDTVDFGFTPGTKYTLGYMCTGGGTPGTIGGNQRVQYLLINRYNESATFFIEESSQLYRIGAQGLPPTPTPSTLSCIRVGGEEGETIWVSAAPRGCTDPNGNLQSVNSNVTAFVCGVANRFDPVVPEACAQIPEVDAIAQINRPDTDLTDVEDYTAYTGTTRRIITAPIVDALSQSGPMIVLGFRQFLIAPNPDQQNINPADVNARFVATYIGSKMPLLQGRMDGCPAQAAGPGKVVLYQ